ncbi:hypothetical protein [Streptomyces sp. L2]|uniref:hypothetical protein n=1 Tax=Streptomyces sp. L2 TaxID=2162665 RepID=UPI0019D70511|nr:hypothetical protein [Streptomyces sp. L2]
MLYVLIVGSEIAFWVLLVAGLLCRYALRRRRASVVLLLMVPAVDLLLFAASTADLVRGAAPTAAHGLAAIYLGVSTAFGGRLVAWADGRLAHRFGGPPPSRPPRYGPEHAAHERRMWGRHLLAWSIGSCLILLDAAIVGDAHRVAPLTGVIGSWGVILAIDFVWSFSYTVFPRKARPDRRGPAEGPPAPVAEPGTGRRGVVATPGPEWGKPPAQSGD